MIAVLKIFNQSSEVVHGFTSKNCGDFSLKGEKNKKDYFSFLKKLNLHSYPLIQVNQVHGDRIILVNKNNLLTKPEADGLISRERNLILGIRSADCLPIIYYEPKKKIIGATHAGRRGLLLEIPKKMIQYIKQLGGKPENTLVGIGPHIGPCCYSLDNQTIQAICQEQPLVKNFIKKEGADKAFLDLLELCRQQLMEVGVNKNNLETSEICTACQHQHWWSYRQEGKACGNMLTVICQKNGSEN